MNRIRSLSKDRPINAHVHQGLVLTLLEKQLQSAAAQLFEKQGKTTPPAD